MKQPSIPVKNRPSHVVEKVGGKVMIWTSGDWALLQEKESERKVSFLLGFFIKVVVDNDHRTD